MSPEVKAVIDAARTAWSEYELTHRPRTHPPTEWHPFETVSPDAGSIETTTMLAIRNALAAHDAAIARAAEQAEGSRDTSCAKGEPDVS